ncbi:MAG: TonB-dependent receptor, partial [Gemmatimonadetes bacterium]|nr:TonB-dependent receptor [Gemmatimonadota bacterium]MYA65630.1 TonB-dependent receptor [Gemmatimonadota bacterium]MYB98532.1 TonB-dependent receptor [Gemmatimonadota bacterium]MYH52209.1 TonB-dependent receptor [Gemmatimonadota bacterium]MYK64914.1 TonB-dependent receptor [Gemmatimonadota bacterium]
MKSRLFLIGALIALAQPGIAAAQGTLRGTVTNASTGAALEGVQVAMADLNMAANTMAGGAYEITGIPAGTHEVEIRLLGFRLERRDVTITDGGTATLNVALTEVALELGGLVAVGSRAQPRTVTESPVPVDVIRTGELINQGDTDFANIIRNVVPSFNVNIQPISDAATFARPANLRGLAPDHTLVLVNGKRRHRTAVITWYGNGLADGSQGPDIALIPGLALEQAEVLRDGASAQYGSDAIAGVMNFALKNDRSGGTIEIKTGGYLLGEDVTSVRFQDGSVPGDGEMYTVSGNVGLPLGETGFLNLTGEYGNSANTDRSTQRNDATALIGAGNSAVRVPAQIWGSPKVSNDIKLWANMGLFLNDNTQFYSHGNYASKQVEGGFYFRNPGTRSGVFGTRNADGQRILLVGDMLDAADGVLDGSAGCPEVPVTDDGVVMDQAALNQVLSDPNCFSFRELFPGGFTPQFGSYVFDASAVVGLKGTSDDLNWDVSASWGKSNLDFYMYNTVNASLGRDQPCADASREISFVVPDQQCTPWFNPGIYDQQETNLNLDLSYPLDDRMNLAGGAEFRNERFEIVRGSTESWTEGPLASQGFTPGSNGFTGFGPLTEGNWNRYNIAAYVDLEIDDPGDAWTLGLAQRIEHFSDFGTTWNVKLAGRLAVSEGFAMRSSASTGFRAPTPGQQNAFNISTIYDPAIMDLTNNGTIPSTNPLAVHFGGQPLKPEKSINLAMGAVYDSGPFSLSMDLFQIRVSDRLTTSADRSLSPDEIRQLEEDGIIREGGVLARFRFFINDFATTTSGIDLVGAYDIEGAGGSNTTISSAWNMTSTKVTEFNEGTLNAHRIRILQEGLPNVRGNVALNHAFAGGTRFLVRGSYWGGYFDGEQPYYESNPGETIDYPARILFDMEASHTFADRWLLTVGGQNVLNTYPEEYPGAAAGVGNRFGQFTPFG